MTIQEVMSPTAPQAASSLSMTQSPFIMLNNQGSNYQLWAKDIKLKLVNLGHWNNSKEESFPKEGSLQALAVIYSSISDFNKSYIVDLKCPKKAWETLSQKYASENISLKVTSIWNLTQKSLTSDFNELRAQLVEQKNLYRDLMEERHQSLLMNSFACLLSWLFLTT